MFIDDDDNNDKRKETSVVMNRADGLGRADLGCPARRLIVGSRCGACEARERGLGPRGAKVQRRPAGLGRSDEGDKRVAIASTVELCLRHDQL
ncbi:hypothetical protein BDA96_09G174000 [Sorghum bicolor]|jgi:hypothetical protein|uniref:Uncharacterized protein n=2 Tax=Sorghum bicolor TaxID=4558 RepID=A0A921U533_SORBI|nr:hypothetical protein BDA96_09G174000 [Sorghum bicolor]OQU78143.1 hypothetical protein SORBI_3009G165050 [Sorghum bicolor]